ncbi:MAG: threonine 3-dehydrogenase [Clostridiales bacterium]|nr:threonine 3-dehydrogenase [Clostridiales bacterium]
MKAVTFRADLVPYVLTLAMGKVNRKLYYSRFSCVRYEEVREPVLPGDDWVKVKTIYGGICGSDINMIYLHDSPLLSPFASRRFVMGHENLGIIVEKGENVEGFEVGDRIVADDVLSCEPRGLERCPKCLSGDYNLCLNFTEGRLSAGTIMGTCADTGGSWGEYYVAHKSQLFKVPDNLKDEEAILIDPLCSALHPVLRNFPRDDEKVLVIGAGIIGILIVASLRAFGSKADITVIAKYDFQGQLAQRYGADRVIYSRDCDVETMAEITGGKVVKPLLGEKYLIGGFDRVFDCVGSENSVRDSLRYINSGGALVLVGLGSKIKLDWSLVWFKEVTIKGVYGYGVDPVDGGRERTFKIGLDLMASGKMDLSPLVTHVFDLKDYKKAIEVASCKKEYQSIKVLLKP